MYGIVINFDLSPGVLINIKAGLTDSVILIRTVNKDNMIPGRYLLNSLLHFGLFHLPEFLAVKLYGHFVRIFFIILFIIIK